MQSSFCEIRALEMIRGNNRSSQVLFAARFALAGRAMNVGRSHIAATVNTLMLAYLGAGLPLLLLFAIGGQSPLMVLNGEIVAVEVIRALVGSVGIVAAVPLTTVVAALLMVPARVQADAA